MKLLLDTHAFLWFVAGDDRMPPTARRRIESPDTEKWLSVASVWEIAIKRSLGKLELDMTVDALVQRGAIDNGMRLLDVRREHVTAVADLPFEHRDPFDRLLVCQARHEGMVLVSRDEILDAYRVERTW